MKRRASPTRPEGVGTLMDPIFKRIFCPVDLSSFSLDALRLAVQIAERDGAGLDVLHVVHNPFDEIYMTALTQTDPALLAATEDFRTDLVVMPPMAAPVSSAW